MSWCNSLARAINADNFSSSVSISDNNFSHDGTGVSIGVTSPSQITSITGNAFGNVDTTLNLQNLTTPVSFDATATNNTASGEPLWIEGGTDGGTLKGTAGADVLRSNGGATTFEHTAGGDEFVGTAGSIDTATGYDASATIGFNSANWTVTDNGSTDTLVGVDKVTIGTQTYDLVDQTGAGVGGFQSIQAAVNGASAGDIIVSSTPVSLTVSLAQSLEAAGVSVSASSVTLVDTAAHIQAMTSAQITALKGVGVTAVNSTDASLVLNVAQISAFESAGVTVGVPGGDTITVSDTASNVTTGLAALTGFPTVASITATGGTVTVPVATFLADESTLNKIVGGFDIADSTTNIQNNLSALNADSSHIDLISTTGGGVPGPGSPVTVSVAEFLADETTLNEDVSGFSISDTAINVQNALSSLAADAGHIDTITATGGVVTVAVGQISADQPALNEIVGGFAVDVTTNTTFAATSVSNVQGFIVESGVTADLSALTANEVVTPSGAGASVTVTFAGTNAELVIGNNLANGSIGGEIVGAAISDSIDFSADIAVYSASNHLSWQQTSANGGVLSLVNSSGTTLGSVELAGSFTTSDFSASAATDGGTLATIAGLLPAPAPDDFNDNRISDVLWRNSTDDSLATWLMNGSAIGSSASVTYGGGVVAPDASWSVAGVADFNGDGDADLLWRQSSTGSLAMWQMNGSTITSSASVTSGGTAVTPDSSWSVAGIGDFNGDGDADILWRQSSTGSLAEWLMNGSAITSSAYVTSGGNAVTPDSTWSVVGVGDFNGDGDADILWRQSTTGSLAMWQMNGSAISSSAYVTSGGNAVTPDSTWSVVGIGDFNGDGDADILWRQSTTGSLAMWLMNGSTITSSANVTSGGNPVAPDSTWNIVEVGDFNGTNQAGILWQQSTTGTLAEWQMNGAQIASSNVVTSQGNPIAPSSNWQVQARPTDFV